MLWQSMNAERRNEKMDNLQTFEITYRMSEENQNKMIAHFEQEFAPLLQEDVSNYAKGRKRLWLEAEPTLTRNFSLTSAHHDSRTWNWILKHVWPGADLGLVSRGPVGITMHRDATYAGWEAYGINLGEPVVFGYRECYGDYRYGPQDDTAAITEIQLQPGDVFRFNCKNPHGVLSPITENRWSVNLWSMKR